MGRIFMVVVALGLLAGCGADQAPEPTSPAPTSVSPSSSPTVTEPTVTEPTVTATVADNLAAPWSVLPLAKGKALVSERNSGDILLLVEGKTAVAGNIPEVAAEGEGGLLGLAMASPQADRVFAYYTSATDNRVVALDFDGQRLSNERTVLSGIPKGFIHNGGRIAFGPDGFLYVATGETGQPELAQERSSLGGKILRITTKGEPAPGNPDPKSPVWSYGHRNVQGLAWDTQGQLWASEFGQNDVDELNLIEPGKNYGWPRCEGPCDIRGMTNPKATWSPTSTASPSGLAIVDGSAWVATLRGETLYQVPLDGDRALKPRAWFGGELGRLRDVVETPEGSLWLVTNNTDGRGEPKSGDDRILDVQLPG
ncbi:MAG: PQQ-dependent sugar dehydrogenase [Candidatus Nanopelagicales bacterium]